MSFLRKLVRPLRRLDLERIVEMTPSYPPVAVELDRGGSVLVRVKGGRSGRSALECHDVREMPETAVGASIFRPNLSAPEEMTSRLKLSFERAGVKPGKISLVLPDNLAKVSIVTLPERPATRQMLHELLRFKLRRSVPFRMEDAVLSWQQIPGDGPELSVLVAVMLRSVVEQYETVVEAAGARPGVVDLCTPSLFNLCREELRGLVAAGGDAALLNCARSYYTLLIVRGDRIVFYRCKSYTSSEEESAGNGVFERELGSSISYYREKLGGQGIGTALVRTTGRSLPEVAATLRELGIENVVPVDPSRAPGLASGARLELELGQRLAPALGAAMGRGH
jgi:type IV pilus assembly protein PilM